jgi:hypothetical protein
MDQSKSTKSDTKSREESFSDSELDYFEVSMIDEKDYKVNTPLVQTSNKINLKSRSGVDQQHYQ